MTLARAAAEVDAANSGLAHLRETPLTSLDEDILAARVIKANFGNVRDALLRRARWNFASTFETLSEDPLASKGRFARTYPLPMDCIRVLEVVGASDGSWCVETRRAGVAGAAADVQVLSTDAVAPRIEYNRADVSPALWDPLFLEVFALKLAAKIGGTLGRDMTELQGWDAQAEGLLRQALRVDEREAAPDRLRNAFPILTARL